MYLCSLTAVLLFVVLASPVMFTLVQSILWSVVTVASPQGLPTVAGLLIHALVFGAATHAVKKACWRGWHGKCGGAGGCPFAKNKGRRGM
jgi:hypothetical protein